MRRRVFLQTLASVAVGLAESVTAQAASKVYQIGFLFPGALAVVPGYVAAERNALESIGLRSNQFEIIERIADGNSALLPSMAADLVARKVDLIFALSPAAVRAARAASNTIPIVALDLESDPIAAGFIASNTRPGGNITGIFLDFPDFSKKWLEALKEAVPQAVNIAVFWDPATGPTQLKAVVAAAEPLRLKLVVLEIRQPRDLEPAFKSAGQRGAG